MASLRDTGMKPVLHILDKVPSTGGPSREQELIDNISMGRGTPFTNLKSLRELQGLREL